MAPTSKTRASSDLRFFPGPSRARSRDRSKIHLRSNSESPRDGGMFEAFLGFPRTLQMCIMSTGRPKGVSGKKRSLPMKGPLVQERPKWRNGPPMMLMMRMMLALLASIIGIIGVPFLLLPGFQAAFGPPGKRERGVTCLAQVRPWIMCMFHGFRPPFAHISNNFVASNLVQCQKCGC